MKISINLFTGNHKDYNNRRHREISSPCEESVFQSGSGGRVPLARSCSSPAATYGKGFFIFYIIFI